jgi:septum formation inhibitor-activating ATPase MinD
LEAVLEIQAQIEIDFNPDFLLIDSRTGITELGGLATCVLADRVVCLTTTAPESVEGTRVVAEALKAAPRMPSQQPVVVEFLVTRVDPVTMSQATKDRLNMALGENYQLIPHDAPITNSEHIDIMSRVKSRNHEQKGVLGTDEFDTDVYAWIARSFQLVTATRGNNEAPHTDL